MDTIIFIVLLAGAIVAWKGMKASVVIPVFALGLVLTLVLFNHHVTSRLDLSF